MVQSGKRERLITDGVCPGHAAFVVCLLGAELANVVNEAALLAVRSGETEVGQEALELALERTRHAKSMAGGAAGISIAGVHLNSGTPPQPPPTH